MNHIRFYLINVPGNTAPLSYREDYPANISSGAIKASRSFFSGTGISVQAVILDRGIAFLI
jgi:hypothetical protein